MNKSNLLLLGANVYAKWAYFTCLFILIADFVFVLTFFVSFSGFEYIVFGIIDKDIFSILFIIINTFFVIQTISYFLYENLDIDFIVLKKLSEMIEDFIDINCFYDFSIFLYEKFIKYRTYSYKELVGLVNIFLFSVGVAGGLHIIITFISWLIIDKFNYQISFLSNLQNWVYHHYPLLCFYVFLYVLSLYAIRIYYLWKNDSDLNKFLGIFPSWKKIIEEHHR